jgi:hypothetical protein
MASGCLCLCFVLSQGVTVCRGRISCVMLLKCWSRLRSHRMAQASEDPRNDDALQGGLTVNSFTSYIGLRDSLLHMNAGQA